MKQQNSQFRIQKADLERALLEFTPETYWPLPEGSNTSPTNELIRRVNFAVQSGEWSNVKMPAIAFAMRGGDFLPRFLRLEVEIARLALESTTWDVISIRARPSGRGIVFRVVDEYESEYQFRPKSSRKPLSLGKLIQSIDGLKSGSRSSSPAALRDFQGPFKDSEKLNQIKTFVTVASSYYPDLESWYLLEASAWLTKRLAELPKRLAREKARGLAEVAQTTSAARAGDPLALTSLGYRHFVGRGAERSFEKAIECWTRAAQLGDPTGKFNLAVCYQDGLGRPRNPEYALELYEQLAADGYAVGLKMAAFCRHVGIGCKPDLQLALRWYFEAAKANGPKRFSDDLIRCLRNMTDKSALKEEAIAWVNNAASLGAAGQNMLAALSKGPTDDPIAHDAGVGYLGDDPLVRVVGK
jgi:hypothetical protein